MTPAHAGLLLLLLLCAVVVAVCWLAGENPDFREAGRALRRLPPGVDRDMQDFLDLSPAEYEALVQRDLEAVRGVHESA